MHQDQPYPKAVQQRDIVHQVSELCIGNGLASKGEYEGAATVRMYIRCRMPESLDELYVSVFRFHILATHTRL